MNSQPSGGWPLSRLGGITTKIGSGATPRGGKESYRNDGISLIRSLNVHDFRFEQDDLAHINEDQAENLANVEVQPQDILLNITGASVARCCMVPSRVLPARVNQHVAIVRTDPCVADPNYVLYCINSPQHKQHLLALAQGGATREALTKKTIEDFQIPLPPLPTQRAIGSFLTAYDELIANNTRRIAILEEMARALYREWFVEFRFPGHERVAMVESELGLIPEGWQMTTLGQVADLNAATLQSGRWLEQINFIDIASVSPGRIEKIDTMPFSEAPGRARRIVRHGDIIWSSVRPNRRSYSIILNPPERLVVSTGFAVMSAKSVPYSYLYHVVTRDEFVECLSNRATGAAYPAVNTADFSSARMLMPPADLLDRFHSHAGVMLEQRQNLFERNINLRCTRDLLLPALFSGDVDITVAACGSG